MKSYFPTVQDQRSNIPLTKIQETSINFKHVVFINPKKCRTACVTLYKKCGPDQLLFNAIEKSKIRQ